MLGRIFGTGEKEAETCVKLRILCVESRLCKGDWIKLELCVDSRLC